MAPPRIEVVGALYHVNAKSIDGGKLFQDDADRSQFLRMLASQARRSDWCVLEYSLLTNHFHLLLELRKLSLSSGFHRLNSTYARRFNGRHGRRGALWQRRYFDSLIETESHLYEVVRYIARNAPRAGLCEAPEDWPWCSYGAAIGAAPADPIVDERELLRYFGPSLDEARENLRSYVEEADPRTRFGQTRVRLLSDRKE